MNNTTTAGQPLNKPADPTCFLPEHGESTLAAEWDELGGNSNNKVVTSGLKQWKIEDKSQLEPRVDPWTEQSIGIDTMNLWMPLVPEMLRTSNELKPLPVRNGKRICPLQYDGATPVYGGEYWDEERGIYIKVSHINSKGYAYGLGVKGCFISFSIPKLSMENNYQMLSFEETRAALTVVEGVARRVGLNIEVEKAGLCRLDLF